MGEYHVFVNTTTREYLDPHDFGENVKRRGLLLGSAAAPGLRVALDTLPHRTRQTVQSGDLAEQMVFTRTL